MSTNLSTEYFSFHSVLPHVLPIALAFSSKPRSPAAFGGDFGCVVGSGPPRLDRERLGLLGMCNPWWVCSIITTG